MDLAGDTGVVDVDVAALATRLRERHAELSLLAAELSVSKVAMRLDRRAAAMGLSLRDGGFTSHGVIPMSPVSVPRSGRSGSGVASLASVSMHDGVVVSASAAGAAVGSADAVVGDVVTGSGAEGAAPAEPMLEGSSAGGGVVDEVVDDPNVVDDADTPDDRDGATAPDNPHHDAQSLQSLQLTEAGERVRRLRVERAQRRAGIVPPPPPKVSPSTRAVAATLSLWDGEPDSPDPLTMTTAVYTPSKCLHVQLRSPVGETVWQGEVSPWSSFTRRTCFQGRQFSSELCDEDNDDATSTNAASTSASLRRGRRGSVSSRSVTGASVGALSTARSFSSSRAGQRRADAASSTFGVSVARSVVEWPGDLLPSVRQLGAPKPPAMAVLFSDRDAAVEGGGPSHSPSQSQPRSPTLRGVGVGVGVGVGAAPSSPSSYDARTPRRSQRVAGGRPHTAAPAAVDGGHVSSPSAMDAVHTFRVQLRASVPASASAGRRSKPVWVQK